MNKNLQNLERTQYLLMQNDVNARLNLCYSTTSEYDIDSSQIKFLKFVLDNETLFKNDALICLAKGKYVYHICFRVNNMWKIDKGLKNLNSWLRPHGICFDSTYMTGLIREALVICATKKLMIIHEMNWIDAQNVMQTFVNSNGGFSR